MAEQKASAQVLTEEVFAQLWFTPQILSDQGLWIMADCRAAITEFEAQGAVPTPEAIRQWLDPAGTDPTVTLALVEWALAQINERDVDNR